MNFRTTLIIIGLLAGIGIAYFLFFQESPEEQAAAPEKPQLHEVYGIPKATVQQIDVSFSEAAYQNLTLRKDATGHWQLETPFPAAADRKKIEQLLDDFLNKRVKQTLEVPEVAQYGLETPAITLSLWTDQTSPAATFLLGEKGINFSVYVKEKTEAHIFLIESSALDDLTKSPADLRDRSVIQFDPENVSKIELTHIGTESEQVICEKQDGTWHLKHPIQAAADVQEIEKLLSELRASQVSTFEADQAAAARPATLENYGLDSPRTQIKLTDAQNTYALALGSAVPSTQGIQAHIYVKALHQEAIYTVNADIYETLNKSAFDLRNKRVIDFQRTDTIRIEIRDDTETTVCAKNTNHTWTLQTPTGEVKADAKAVDDLLFGTDSLEAETFVDAPISDLTAYGLAPPSISVAFTQRGEDKPAVLQIGNAAADGSTYVKAESSNQVATVAPTLIEKIAQGTAWLRDKQVLNFHIDDAIRLTFRGKESLTCQRLGTNWRLTAPVQENANNAVVNAIIYELDDLMAAAYVRNGTALTDAATGFSTPQVQLTVELRDQKVYTLHVGNADPSGRFYSRLHHQPDLVFLLNAELIPKLKPALAQLRVSVAP